MKRLLILMALAVPACGQGAPSARREPAVKQVTATPPGRATCPAWHPPEDGKDYGLHLTEPLPVPAEFQAIASADTTVMTVQSLSGTPICVTLDWVGEASNFWLSPDKRFLGFSYTGLEVDGYTLVDRAGSGQDIETGVMPTFSADRTLFASAQRTVSGTGGLEAIALWQVRAKDIAELARIEAGMPEGYEEWTVSGVGPGPCVWLSAISSKAMERINAAEGDDAQIAAYQAAPRDDFRFAPIGGKWRVVKVDREPCSAAARS